MNILTKSILTTLAALAIVSNTRAETFPVFEDAAGSPTTRIIKKAAGTAATLPVNSKSAAFINFSVGSAGYSASQVSAARLVVYFPSVTKPGNLNVAVGTSAFQEKLATPSITLASVPAGGFDTIPVDASLKKSFFIVDVTAQVKNWLTNPNSEFGFVITSDGVANCTIGAKEGSGSGYPAVLEVDIAGGSTANGNFLFNGGDVGVGTTSPSHRLSIESDGIALLSLSSTGAGGGRFDINYTGIQSAEGLYFSESGVNSSNLVLREGGNVGISTANPSSKLDVNGGVKANGTDGYTFNSGDADGGLFSPADGQLTLKTNNTDRLFINASGNVGIGTNAPAAQLGITGVGTVPALRINAGGPVGTDYRSNLLSLKNWNGPGVFNVNYEGDAGKPGLYFGEENVNGKHLVIREGGNIGIGTSDAAAKLHIKAQSPNSRDNGIRLENALNSSRWNIHTQESFDILVFSFNDQFSSSNYSYLSPAVAGLISTSDIRTKKDIEPFTSALDNVMKLRPVTFRYKTAADGSPVNFGFIAQEVEQVYPDIVLENNGLKTLANNSLIAINTEAIRELKTQKDTEIAALKAANAALEAKLAAFGEKLAALETAKETHTARSEAPAPQPATVEVK